MTQINFKIDDTLKKNLENVCEDSHVPIEIPLYNSQTLKTMDETQQNINMSCTFESVDELFKDLSLF